MGIKIMKIYKDTFNKLWGYEIDGSQDHLIPDDFIQITDAEAEEIRLSQTAIQEDIVSPTASELMAQLQAIQLQIEALEVK
jgi:hypothetical protein